MVKLSKVKCKVTQYTHTPKFLSIALYTISLYFNFFHPQCVHVPIDNSVSPSSLLQQLPDISACIFVNRQNTDAVITSTIHFRLIIVIEDFL